MNQKFLIVAAMLVCFGASTSSSAADDALSRLKAAVAQGRQQIDEIAAKDSPDAADLKALSHFIHESGNLHVEVPMEALIRPARQAMVNIANKYPLTFSEYVTENLNDLRVYPYQVADLILMAMTGAPQIIQVLADQNVIGSGAIDRALERNTGFYPINTGWAGSGRADVRTVSGNLDAQLPDKVRIAIALFDAGIRSNRINEILIEGVELKSLLSDLKIAAMERLGKSGTTSDRAVAALKSVVMPPVILAGATVREMNNFRPTAVAAISAIPTQASVDALWEIAGLDTSSTPTSRPLPDTATVIAMAKEGRQNLLRLGTFKNRSVLERAMRGIARLGGSAQ